MGSAASPRQEVDLFLEGIVGLEDDFLVDGLTENLVVELVLDGIGLGVDLGLEGVLGVLLAGRHDVGEEQLDVEDVLAAFLVGIPGIEVGVGLGGATALLELGHHLTLRLELGLDQLVLGTTIGDARVVHGKAETVGDVVLAGVGLAPREDALGGPGTLIDLEGLVLELRTDPTAQVPVFDGLVLVEDTHDATVALGGQAHESLDHVLGHDTVVDVAHEVTDAIEDHQVGMTEADDRLEVWQAVGKGTLADVEDVELLHGKLILLDACHLADTLTEDVLRGLITLFGVIPEDVQLPRLDPFDGEHFVAKAQRHQDAADKRLTALGLAGEAHQFATGEAGLAMKPEEELHGWELLVGRDPTFFQPRKPLLVFQGASGQGQLPKYEFRCVRVHRLGHLGIRDPRPDRCSRNRRTSWC